MGALLASTQSFYFATLEEYYIGGLFLGVGNGATDGAVPIIALFLYAGYTGTDGFKTSIPLLGTSFSATFGEWFGYVIMCT